MSARRERADSCVVSGAKAASARTRTVAVPALLEPAHAGQDAALAKGCALLERCNGADETTCWACRNIGRVGASIAPLAASERSPPWRIFMQCSSAAFVIATSLVFSACRSEGDGRSPERKNAERALVARAGDVTETIRFQHQDARFAANYARKEFGTPPMDGVVQVVIDAGTNSWVVHASPADMERVKAIAARFDQPGEPVWSKKQS